MGVVKYTGPVASFHCPTNAEIRSLKVHFSPKQSGSGDPSPSNIRPIEGWTNLNLNYCSKNLWTFGNKTWTNNGATITANGSSIHISGTNDGSSWGIYSDNPPYILLPAGTYSWRVPYRWENNYGFFCTKYFDAPAGSGSVIIPDAGMLTGTFTITEPRKLYIGIGVYGNTNTSYKENINKDYSFILVEGSEIPDYEPYQGSITNYEFGVLGKNKFDGEYSDIKNSTTLTYRNIYVGNQIITASSNMPKTTEHKWSNLFILPGQVTSGAATGMNDFNAEISRTITPIDGWITIAYRNTEGIDPRDYQTQLELGSTATAYEPYDPNHTVYGGWVDLISGEVCEEYKIIDLSMMTWFPYARSSGGIEDRIQSNVISDIVRPATTSVVPNLIAEQFYAIPANYNFSNYPNGISVHPSQGYLYKYFDGENYPSGKMVYKLLTPITYHLAPTQLQTFLGQNNVWSNADYVEVEYDLHETQDILARKQFIIANQPHLEEASGSIATFNTDMSALSKECKVHFEPKQDLHGYSNPWPAGGGRNIFHITAQSQTSETGVVFTVNSDGSVKAVGNPSISTPLDLGTITLPAGTYKIQGGISNTAYLNIPSKVNSYGGAASFTVAEGGETITPRIYITANTEVNGTFYPMIKVGSDNDATWEPYENICPIKGWTGINIAKSGTNLLNIETSTIGYKLGSATGQLEKNDVFDTSDYIPMQGGQTLYLKNVCRATAAYCLFCYDKNKNYILNSAGRLSGGENGMTSGTLITAAGTAYIRVVYSHSATEVAVNYPSTNTSYYAYNGQIIPIDWTSNGTIYGGYVDLAKGELVATYGSIALDSLGWAWRSEGLFLSSAVSNMKTWSNYYHVLNWYCNSYNVGTTNSMPQHNNEITATKDSSQLRVRDDRYTSDTPGFISSLDGVTLVYELATPITYQLTPAQLKTLRGTNNIWSNTNNNITVSYWKH